MEITAIELVTLVIAIVGAVLGLLNTWRTFNNDRVRLRVRESMAIASSGERAITIDVVNLSTFPVTVTTVGFDLLGGGEHMQIPRPIFTRAESLPVRLEPRAACTVVQPLSAINEERWRLVACAYVNTACGLHVQGKGRIFG